MFGWNKNSLEMGNEKKVKKKCNKFTFLVLVQINNIKILFMINF